MAAAFVKNHPVAFNKTAGTTLALTLSTDVPAGNLIVCRMVYDNAGTASKPLIASIGVAAGETASWSGTGLNINSTSTSAGSFASGGMRFLRTTVLWPAGSYTVTLDTSTVQKAGAFQEFADVTTNGAGVLGTNYSTTTTAASASGGAGAVAGDLVLGFIFGSNVAAAQAGDNDTTGGAWSAVFGIGSTGSSGATNNYGVAQYKIATASGTQTLNNSAAMTAGNGALLVALQQDIPPSITVAAYRIYDDGTETGAVALAAQDTAHTGDITTGDGIGQLRIRLQSTTAVVVPATDDFQLQWEKNASGSWTNVVSGSGSVRGFDSASLTEGAATTNRLTGGSGGFVAGKVSEDGLADNVGWASNNFTELLYTVQIMNTDFVHGDTIRFRVLRNGVTTTMTYSQTPTVNIVNLSQTWTGSTGAIGAGGTSGSLTEEGGAPLPLTVATPIAIWSGVTSPSFTVEANDLVIVGYGILNGTLAAPTNTGTAFTWAQRTTSSFVVWQRLYSTIASVGQTMTVSIPNGDFEVGFVWVIKYYKASPFGVSSTIDNTTTNALTVNYTATEAGSVTLVMAFEYQELGAPTSNLTDQNVDATIAGFAMALYGHKPNASAGANSFLVDAFGTGTPGWNISYLEILPFAAPVAPQTWTGTTTGAIGAAGTTGSFTTGAVIASWSEEANISLGSNNPIPSPAGVTTGDLLLAFADNVSTAAALTASTGWVQIYAEVTTSVVIQGSCFGRIADGGANDTLSLTGAANDYCALILRIVNHGVTNVATDIKFGTFISTGSTQADPPSLDAGSSKEWLWLAATQIEGSGSVIINNLPTNYTLVQKQRSGSGSSNCEQGVLYRYLAPTQTENPGPFTGVYFNGVSTTMAIPPYVPPPPGGASVTLGAVTVNGGAVNSVTKPAGATTGDRYVISVFDMGNQTAPTFASSGFTPHGSVQQVNWGERWNVQTLSRPYDGSEGSSFTITGVGGWCYLYCYVAKGAGDTPLIGTFVVTGPNAVIPGVTIIDNGSLAMIHWADYNGSQTVTPPSGWTLENTGTLGATALLSNPVDAGATGTATVARSNTGNNNGGYMVAWAPAAVPSGGYDPATDVPNLKLYVESDPSTFSFSSGVNITQWRDKSDNDYILVPRAGDSSPTLVDTALGDIVYFVGASDSAKTPLDLVTDFHSGSPNLTVSMVVYAENGAFARVLSMGDPGSVDYNQLGGVAINPESGNVYPSGYRNGTQIATGPSTTWLHKWIVMTYVWDSAGNKLYVDGVLTDTKVGSPGDWDINKITMGGQIQGEESTQNMRVAALVISGDALAGADLDDLHKFLKYKWSIRAVYLETFEYADNAAWPATITGPPNRGLEYLQSGAAPTVQSNRLRSITGPDPYNECACFIGVANPHPDAFTWTMDTEFSHTNGWAEIRCCFGGGHSYQCEINRDSGSFSLQRDGTGVASGPTGITWAANAVIHWKLERLTNTVKARWWIDDDPEPTTWACEWLDSSPLAGGQALFTYKTGETGGALTIYTDNIAVWDGVPPEVFAGPAPPADQTWTGSSGTIGVAGTTGSFTLAGVPTAPLNLTVIGITGTTVDLDWDAPSSDGGTTITTYVVEYRTAETTEVGDTFTGDVNPLPAPWTPRNGTNFMQKLGGLAVPVDNGIDATYRYGNVSSPDMWVQASIRNDNGYAGVQARIKDSPFRNEGVDAVINPGNNFAINRFNNSTETEMDFAGGAVDGFTYLIRVECLGDNIKMFVDGALVNEATSSLHNDGLGVGIGSYRNAAGPNTLTIDNFAAGRLAGTWQTFSHSASPTTAITVTGLTPGLLYDFRVAAYNGSTGPYSTTVQATPTPPAQTWTGTTNATIGVAGATGAFAPGAITWTGTTNATMGVAGTTGAFVPGVVAWTGTITGAIGAQGVTGVFVGGPTTWIDTTTGAAGATGSTGAFVAGTAAWPGTTNAAIGAAGATALMVGGATTWTGTITGALGAQGASGNFVSGASPQTWAGTVDAAIGVTGISALFVPGPVVWGGPGPPLIDDTFDGTAGTPLSSLGWSGDGYSPMMNVDGAGNAVLVDSGGWGGVVHPTPLPDDCWVEATFATFREPSWLWFYLELRMPALSWNDGYNVLLVEDGSGGLAYILRNDNIEESTGVPAPWTPGATHTLRLEAQGANFKVFLDGALKIDWTDPVPLAPPNAGPYSGFALSLSPPYTPVDEVKIRSYKAGGFAAVATVGFGGTTSSFVSDTTWAGSTATIGAAGATGTMVGGATTWTGSGTATIGVTGTSGNFQSGASPQTWTGTSGEIGTAGVTALFVGGPITWTGTALATVGVAGTSSSFLPGVITWAGSTGTIGAAGTTDLFVPSAVVWAGSIATLGVAGITALFAPGAATWTGSTGTMGATGQTGAMVGGPTVWAGSLAEVGVLGGSGNFSTANSPQTWTSSAAQIGVAGQPGAFQAAPITWTGSAATIGVAGQTGVFISAATWVGSLAQVGLAGQTGVFIGGATVWTGSVAIVGMAGAPGLFASEVVWTGSAATVGVAGTTGLFVAGGITWAGTTGVLGVTGLSGLLIPGLAPWLGSTAQIGVVGTPGVFGLGAAPQVWLGSIALIGLTGVSGTWETWFGLIMLGQWNGQTVVDMRWGDQEVIEYILTPP